MVEKSFDFSRGSVDGAHISDLRDKTSLSDVSLLGGDKWWCDYRYDCWV